MKQKLRSWRDGFRFSQSLQMIGLITILLLVCMILVQVYSGTVSASRKTHQLNDGVALSRSIAECYTATGSLEETAQQYGVSAQSDEAQLWFDGDLAPVQESDSTYTVTLQETIQPTDAGSLKNCAIAVAADGETIYTLTVSVYCAGAQ